VHLGIEAISGGRRGPRGSRDQAGKRPPPAEGGARRPGSVFEVVAERGADTRNRQDPAVALRDALIGEIRVTPPHDQKTGRA
jgi:hypothetical protein